MRRFAAVVALVLLVTSCTVRRGGEALSGEPTWEFDLRSGDVLIEPGDIFLIKVDDNASVGDKWSVSRVPDPGVVETEGDHYESDSAGDVAGGGGKRYFRFVARRPGTTSIELRNCFRGCREQADDRRYEMAVEVR